jgi:cadmium resistance protein CadD (predicted permease)
MSTKAAILASIGIFVALLLIAVVLLVMFVDPSTRRATERAGLIGQGVGMAGLVPLFVIWILWAARVRKEREAKQAGKP